LRPSMGRYPRVQFCQGQYHVIARFNNKDFFLQERSDFLKYLSILKLIQKKHEFLLFNYELMNSHVHLFLQPTSQIPLSKSMMMIHWQFARYCNKQKNRKGHVWMDRYKSIPVESEYYALALMRYINRNPMRAGMVKHLGEWTWSAYPYYAFGKPDDLITPHPAYLGLGRTDQTRQQEYAALVNMRLPGDDLRDPAFSDSRTFGLKAK
jgi:putative transposase